MTPEKTRARRPTLSASPRRQDGFPELLVALADELIRRGLGVRAFDQYARHAYLNAALRTATFSNGKANRSRVSAQTGLNRAEVRRLMRACGPAFADLRPSPMCRVMIAWSADRDFADSRGTPKPLPISGKSRSFTALAERYAADIPARAVLDALRSIGAVRVLDRTVVPNKTQRIKRNSFFRNVPNLLAPDTRT